MAVCGAKVRINVLLGVIKVSHDRSMNEPKNQEKKIGFANA